MEFSVKKRRSICTHEAAHAVIHALGGSYIKALRVAPVGATGLTGDDCAFGTCRAAAPAYPVTALLWDDSASFWKAQPKVFNKFLKNFDMATQAEVIRQMRAHMCGLMAGPISEMIADGFDEIYLEPDINDGPREDVNKAYGYFLILPGADDFDLLTAETERLLRTPDIWNRVTKLADALEEAGILGDGEDEIPFLPEQLTAWPPCR